MTSIPTTLVSIILTTLNSERFIAHSIESCIKQTYCDLELIVVDGGSLDRTLDIVASFNDSRVRIVHQEDNAGKLPGAINLGMAAARGEFITWTQDDCWYEPNAIETMVEYLGANPDVAFVYTDFWEVDTDKKPLRYHPVKPPEFLMTEGDVVGVSFLFRRKVYEEIGPQEVKYYSVHELPWRIKAAQLFQLEPLHVSLMHYMVHKDSLTGRFGHWTEQRKALDVMQQEGYVNQDEYSRRLAALDLHEAYEEYIFHGNYRTFWSCVLGSIRRDASSLANVGLCKMMLMSLSPMREWYRLRQLETWQKSTAALLDGPIHNHSS